MCLKQITTPRLLLRPLSPQDVREKYVGWLNDPQVNQYLETRFEVQTIDSCLAFVNLINADQNSHLFGIFDLEKSLHIGNIKLGPIHPRHKWGDLSLFIGEKLFWGHGLATEAISAVTFWAFTSCGLEKVEAGCYAENIGSLRAFLKCGYSVEGYLRNHVQINDRRNGCFRLGISRSELQ